MTRPFLDQPIQLDPFSRASALRKMRTTLAGSSKLYAFDTLQTLKSPSCFWTASISDFCRDEEACQERLMTGEGPLEVVKLCRILKRGCKVAIRSDPV